jgi:hypothetical protein
MQIFVYADGRMITQREGCWDCGPVEGVLDHFTGYIEQRLTREGVELLRAEVLSSGLFEEHHELGGVPCGIQVRNGDRLGSVACAREMTPEQIGWEIWLRERLIDPAKWLPPSAWEDYAHRPYVASTYMVCLWNAETSVLPDAAESVLTEGTPATPPPNDPDDNTSCTDLSTEQARRLAAALDDAGMQGEPSRGNGLLYGLVKPGAKDAGNIAFTPYLPHGEAP